ncbi:MAG TPA: NAD-dependent succinate-semialdehyde dehydrogenase [Caulobacteraceae bacterium]|jgi:succinate-semialdehyde dehydrogenase/glutarate-semialdehyde dehydrogenase
MTQTTTLEPAVTAGQLAANPLKLKRLDLIKTQAFIGGRWLGDPSGKVFDVVNPADAGLIVAVADGGADLAKQAVDAASEAFKTWRNTTVKTRSGLLRAWFDLITAHAEDLAKLIAWEMGKPVAEAKGEVAYGAGYLEWFAEAIKHENGDIIPAPIAGRQMLAVREPVGVAAVITPWNFPVAMIARKFGPALAAGCTVVAKPAEDTPLSALALVALAEEAGIPAGVINIIPASRERTPQISQVWMDDARVRKISFTGSTPVGKLLAKGSAETLKRLSMELGGDAPFIVFDDADLDIAVDALMKAKFRNAGQACIAANRVLVQDGIYDALAQRMTAAVGKLTVGAAADGAFDIGPLINSRALDKVERLVGEAKAHGAKVLVGGARDPAGETFYQPTVLADMPPEMRASCEEIFGPVLPLARFSTEDEAVALANDTPFGLASYFCTQDQKRIWRVAARLESGLVGVNEGAISSEYAPFGGVKESGYGREGSSHGLADYQSLKYVCLGGLG